MEELIQNMQQQINNITNFTELDLYDFLIILILIIVFIGVIDSIVNLFHIKYNSDKKNKIDFLLLFKYLLKYISIAIFAGYLIIIPIKTLEIFLDKNYNFSIEFDQVLIFIGIILGFTSKGLNEYIKKKDN